MKFQVITLFPNMIEAFCQEGVVGQARRKHKISITCVNPRDFATDLHKTVDDRPFGGGDGMVMMVEPLRKALQAALEADPEADPWIVYLSPQGSPLNQEKVVELSQRKNLILVCGRYGGIDQRITNQFVDEEISVGDYVLSGGELAAGIMVDSVSRHVPGVLGHSASVLADSFSSQLDGLLEAPSYTRPREFLGEVVPEILLGGNHTKMEKWRWRVSILVTLLKRPDLILHRSFDSTELAELKRFWKGLSQSEKGVLGLSTLSEKDLELLGYDSINLEE